MSSIITVPRRCCTRTHVAVDTVFLHDQANNAYDGCHGATTVTCCQHSCRAEPTSAARAAAATASGFSCGLEPMVATRLLATGGFVAAAGSGAGPGAVAAGAVAASAAARAVQHDPTGPFFSVHTNPADCVRDAASTPTDHLQDIYSC